ncbi:hypothetical protein VSDG_04392 [Cytospora chrysosperma]|uniref:cyclin-dependent kinase n=1 Tax=Cytospora chrysosperma TaxID=252740 RepID=A0A423W4L5_CYTCH|nr:hypothetical protein VSDG_04392 [Valsa sordida]
MSSKGKSRWADNEEDAAREAQVKREKEEKKRAKLQRRAQQEHQRLREAEEAEGQQQGADGRPAKRRKLTPEPQGGGKKGDGPGAGAKLLRLQGGGFGKSRSVENYDKLNDIEEGAYGWVARAKEIATGRIVALKRLKIEPNDRNGLPVTGLREIQILKDCSHKNIVGLQEVVVGEDTTRIENIFLLLTREPLLQGKNEVDELTRIFELCGVPTDDTWPGFRRLPNAKSLRLPANRATAGSVVRAKFPLLTAAGAALLNGLLSLNPARRPSAKEMMDHEYFRQDPRPKSEAMFPTFPSKAGQERRRRRDTPNAPGRGQAAELGAVDFSGIFNGREKEERGGGFSLRMV